MRVKKILGLVLTGALLCSAAAVPVSALESGVYTGSVTTSYYNPDTGNVDDGGTANAALGEGMCRSATAETGLVEVDKNGNTWVTIRLLLQSNCSDVSFYTRTGYDSYSKVNYTVTAENASADSIDYRFKVSDAGVKIKATMYVTPMGRDVLWYLYVNTGSLTSGSGDFEVSIDTSAAAQSSSGTSGSTSSSQGKTTAVSAAAGGTAAQTPAGTQEEPAEEVTEEEQTEEPTEEEEQPDDADSADEEQQDAEESDSTGDDEEAGPVSTSAENSGSGMTAAVVTVILVVVIAACAASYIAKKKKADK